MTPTVYSEGDWFAVPLPDGGYGTGLIARMQPSRGGVLFGYFFGPREAGLPNLDQQRHREPGDAVMVRLFGHLAIRHGHWPILGRTPEWDRGIWAMPAFLRKPSLGPAVLVRRADDDPSTIMSEAIVDGASPDAQPEGLLGSALAATLLARRI